MGAGPQPIERFGLAPLAGSQPRSALLFDGEPCGVEVDGVSLDAQFRLGERYLLFLTEDSPYEEGLHVYLLDAGRRVLDAVALGAPYAGGILGELRAEGTRALGFSFLGGDRWRLEVLDAPRTGLAARPFAPVRHKGGLLGRRWLRLRRVA